MQCEFENKYKNTIFLNVKIYNILKFDILQSLFFACLFLGKSETLINFAVLLKIPQN